MDTLSFLDDNLSSTCQQHINRGFSENIPPNIKCETPLNNSMHSFEEIITNSNLGMNKLYIVLI